MHSLRPIKRLGQNFLIDPNVARKIVDVLRAPADARVVEIGPGTGALTSLLVERYADFVAIEVDERAVALLRDRYDRLDVRLQDVLQVDWSALRGGGEPIYVIGNLPYYATSQIIFALLSHRDHIREAVLMMQREVADRLVAPPRTKAYGILSVILRHFAEVEALFKVSRNVFHPKPDVTSAVVRIAFRRKGSEEVDYDLFRTVVRTAFNQRRKTLRNSLGPLFAKSGCEVPEEVSGRRAEELSPDEFVALTLGMACS